MKNVKLVLSVVAMVDGEKESKVVYGTEKIFGGAKAEASTEAQLVTELIGSASGGIVMKPDSVKEFKSLLAEDKAPEPEPKKETPPPPPPPPADPPKDDEGKGKAEGEGEGGGKKKAAKKTASKKKAGKKKSSRGK